MVLLLAAGLLVRSFNQLLASISVSQEKCINLQLGLPRSKYSEPQTINFHRDLMERLKTLPGVQSVGTINHIPFTGFGIVVHTGIEGNPAPKRKDPAIGVGSVSTDYFRTMKIPLLADACTTNVTQPTQQRLQSLTRHSRRSILLALRLSVSMLALAAKMDSAEPLLGSSET